MARTPIAARGFSTNQAKLLAAGVLAITGAGFAVWSLLPTRSERTDIPKPSIVMPDGTTPTPVPRRNRGGANEDRLRAADFGWTSDDNADREYVFQKLGNAEDTSAIFENAGLAVDVLGGQEPGLGDAFAAVMSPAAGGTGSLTEAFAALGATGAAPTLVPEAVLATMLDGAEIDPTNLIVRRPDDQPRAIGGLSMGRNIDRSTAEDGETVDEIATTTLSTSFEAHFPQAVGEDARGELAEILVPFRVKGSSSDTPDLTVRLVMRNVSGQWQPAAADLITTDPDLPQRAMKAVRDAASSMNSTQGG